MNLEESDLYKESIEKTKKGRTSIIISLAICTCLIIIFTIMIMIIKYQDSITEKMYIDGEQIGIPKNLYVEVEGDKYFNVRKLSELLGYEYTIGEYGQYNEEKDSCYLQNDFEILTITAGAKKYTKYLQVKSGVKLGGVKVSASNSNGYSESFNLEKTVQFDEKNEILYVPAEYVEEMFNIKLEWKEYRLNIYTLNYIANTAQKVVTKAGLKHMSGCYENMRALLDGYIVVSTSEASKKENAYGVISLSNGKEIISKKYDNILYTQNTKEFYITAANGTVGILSNTGEQIIAPSEFESIKLLDQENKLYLVKKGKEYGVLDGKGNVIIYAEYDKIGIDVSSYKNDNIENNALFFGKCIPVQKGKKYGLFDTEGNNVLDITYDKFGYKTTQKNTSSGSEESVLLIPSYVGINGIVFNYNDMYGIFDANTGKMAYPAVFSKVYAITKSGEKTYYVEFDGQTINLADKLREDNLNNVDEKGNYLGNNPVENVSEPEETEVVDSEILTTE